MLLKILHTQNSITHNCENWKSLDMTSGSLYASVSGGDSGSVGQPIGKGTKILEHVNTL